MPCLLQIISGPQATLPAERVKIGDSKSPSAKVSYIYSLFHFHAQYFHTRKPMTVIHHIDTECILWITRIRSGSEDDYFFLAALRPVGYNSSGLT